MANKKTKKKKKKKKHTKLKKTALRKTAASKGKPVKKKVGKKLAKKKAAPKTKPALKKAAVKTKATRKRTEGAKTTDAFTPSRSAVQSGDLQGLSNVETADSESVGELIEEGNAFEAEVVAGVQDAGSHDEREVRTHEVPEDDVPDEYLDKD
jgi:hypothetical protein